MFEEGNILYFDPFYFKNGNKAKPKYFLVLKVVGNTNLIVSLPSSQDFVPSHFENNFGCIDSPEDCFNCFVIEKGAIITTNQKSFPQNTFLYGAYLDEYSTDFIEKIYPTEGIDYELWGKLNPSIYKQILTCFKKSSTVKLKFVRKL